MAYKLSAGSTISVADTYGDSITVTAITNAETAVATATDHGLVEGDYVEVTSGWEELNNRVVRVGTVNDTTFELEGIDTTDVDIYPENGGIGSVRKIESFTRIQQVLSISVSGGEMQNVTYSPLESRHDYQIPATYSAQSISISIGDDPTLPGYKTLKKWSQSRKICAMLVRAPDKSEVLFNGYVALNEMPSMDKDSVMTVTVDYALQSQLVRYA